MPVLFLITVLTFCMAIFIEKCAVGKFACYITVCLCILLLIGYKIWGNADSSIVIPIGLSFYLFQVIGYLLDVYHKKTSAEKNFIFFALYLSFFPKLVSGPLERKDNFIKQLPLLQQVSFWDKKRITSAFTYLLYGYFIKMVIADRFVLITDKLFAAPNSYDSLWLLLGAFFYTIQIYCDFAGYSFIAIGCAQLFGISLTKNFNTPYCATSISDFWRRWHISLSSWLRDYLYIPLGGSQRGRFGKCLNTLIVFIICGLWHGFGLTFLIWGLLHGLYSVIDTLLLHRGRKKTAYGAVLTFAEVAFAWIFFRADNFSSAIMYLHRLFTTGFLPSDWNTIMTSLNLNYIELIVIFAGILFLFLSDIMSSRHQLTFPEYILTKGQVPRYIVFYLLIICLFIFGMYGPGYHSEQFIYMQF